MAADKRNPQQQSRRARMAEKEAEKRAAQRRWTIAIGCGAVAILLLVVVMTVTNGDDSTNVQTDSTTTTAPATESAAGKPCVAMTSPLPPGAPDVPVKEGPPPTELVSEDLKVGDGPEVTPGATVTVQYIGVSCSTGEIFDASYAGGEPATFGLGEVIPGWTNGIPGMKVGGQRLLGIPPDQAYGPTGQPPVIGPDETLWFVVEMLDTKPAG